MKLLVFLAVIAFVGAKGVTDEQKEKLKQIGKECQEQTGISDETIEKIRGKDTTIDDPKLKDQAFCIWKKLGFINDAGDIDVEKLKSSLKKVADNDEEVDKVVAKCAVKKGTPGETAHSAFLCFRESRPAED